MSDLKNGLQIILQHAEAIARARKAADEELVRIEGLLIGQHIEFGLGRLRGKYQITDVDLSAYNGEVKAHGRKVLPNGKLGNKRWDIGRITARRLGL
jgi:hypothetical protein